MNYNDFEDNLVRVNQGSGVLVPAMTDEFCYVFTAKHNLSKNENSITDRNGVELGKVKSDLCFPHQDRDAAVIILNGVAPKSLLLDRQSLGRKQEITLGGFPSTRFKLVGEDATRFFDGEIKRADEYEFSIFCQEFPTQDDIMGVSGGGVFVDFDSEWILAGIEYSVEREGEENNTQLKVCRTLVFEQIIRDNTLPLALPSFLRSFNLLISLAFNLNGTFFDGNKQKALSQLLQNYAKLSLELTQITPESLRANFGIQLLIKHTPEFCVSDRKLWVSWLEFMTLSLMIDGKQPADLTMDYVNDLHKKRRLLYSNSKEDWSKFIRNIDHTDMDGIEDGAIVIVSNDCQLPPTKAMIDYSKLAVDIGLINSRPFDFTKAPRATPSRILHLDGIHAQCINNKEDEYDCKDYQTTIDKIKNEYLATIS